MKAGSPFFRLLHPTALGEFFSVMRGEDEFGTDFFVHGKEETPAPSAIDVDVDISFKKFERLRPDYLQTTCGVPLLSGDFAENAPPELLNDVDLIPAELHLRGGRRGYFAAKTRKYLKLVDADTSKFSDIRGIKILTKPAFEVPAESFHVARDVEFRRVFVASERMITLIKDRNLRVEYLPY